MLAWFVTVLIIPWPFQEIFPRLWFLYATGIGWILFRSASGLYPPSAISQPDELRLSVKTTMAAGFIHVAMLTAVAGTGGWRVASLGVWLVLIPISYLCRSMTKTLLSRRRLFGDPYVVIGTGEKAKIAIREMQANPGLGQVPVAVFGDQPELWDSELEGIPVLGSIEEVERYAFPYPVRHAMIALAPWEGDNTRIDQIVSAISHSFPTLHVLADLTNPSDLWVRSLPIGPYLSLKRNYARFSSVQKSVKRAFDLLLTVPIFITAVPIIGIAALLVKIIDPSGPAFFSQMREGVHGTPVRIWKIRTMVIGAEKRMDEHLASDPAARSEYERTLKLRHDPRVIPKVGRFLRRYSIDELPQLWNVLKGNLSLIGPRVMLGPVSV